MRSLRLLLRAAPIDLLNIRRDPLLVWIPFLPFLLALLYRFGLPPLEAWLLEAHAVQIASLHPLLMSLFLLLVPTVAGMMTGFLLLDERDDRTLEALRVTPLSLRLYLGYRVVVPTTLGMVLTLLVYPVPGLVPIRIAPLLATAFLASLTAPLVMLFLAAFAENKVAGFAMVKLMNGLLLLPLGAFFVAPPLQHLAGIIPSYWAMRAFWSAAAGESLAPFLAAGVATHAIACGLLFSRLRARVER